MDEPKITSAAPINDFDELFRAYQTGQFNQRTHVSGNQGQNTSHGKTTESSGWIRVVDCNQLRQKSLALPSAWKASGGSDPQLAEDAVREFKQNAKRLLSANVGAMDDEVIQVVRQINQKSCIVHEIRVKLLRVSETAFQGSHKSGDLYFGEVTLRKFYVTQVPLRELLVAAAEMLADPTCAINGYGHVVIARADGQADGRATDHGRFRIVSKAYSEKDMETKKIIDFLNSRRLQI
jgi:hypothetical protein